jgi:hypothetical protein
MSVALRLLIPVLLGLVAVLGTAGAAGAAPLSGVLATDAGPGPVAAYANTAAWSRWDEAAGGYRLVVNRGGRVRTLDVPVATRPFAVTAGRGPSGSTWLVWSRCAGSSTDVEGECDVEGYDLARNTPKAFPFAARAGVQERAPAIHGDRLLYVTGGTTDVGVVHLSALDGSDDRILDVLPTTTCGLSLYGECEAVTRATPVASALRLGVAAVASRVSTAGDDVGICGLANVRLLDLRTGVARTVDDAICGLSGQALSDLAFDTDGRLWWRQRCGGDQSACLGTAGGPFRQGLSARQRLVNALGSRLSGVAVAGRTPLLASRAPRTQAGCTPGPQEAEYRCTTIATVASPAFEPLRPEPERLPPAGYLTVKGGSRVLLLRPPATMACSRGETAPRPGATLWAGASWLRADPRLRTAGPAVPVRATSRGRAVRGTVSRGPKGWEGQRTAQLDLGTPARACGRTWTLTYRPPGGAAVRFTTRVLAR